MVILCWLGVHLWTADWYMASDEYERNVGLLLPNVRGIPV